MKHFGEIAFTETVKQAQAEMGSREAYKAMLERHPPIGLGENEQAFIAERDSFYMASVSETGWPYVQHRGGPKGFLKMLSSTELGFADYRGNRQYISVGNVRTDPRVSLFLMDYPNRRRLKLLGEVSLVSAEDRPDLVEQLHTEGQGRMERLFLIDVQAYDWNCPQFITPRFSETEIRKLVSPIMTELEELKALNKQQAEELARLRTQVKT